MRRVKKGQPRRSAESSLASLPSSVGIGRSRWQTAADELAQARARGEIDDEPWFKEMAAIFDAAYLAGDNPRSQSGFGGDEARWEAGRRPIVPGRDLPRYRLREWPPDGVRRPLDAASGGAIRA